MDKKHTPGPWKIQRDLYNTPYNELGFGVYSEVTHLRVANIEPAITAEFHGMENQEGTALLIAAAPELLETLEKVTRQLAHLYHNGQLRANAPERERIQQLIVDAEYAIEKATQAAE